jgi:hypothetical protein
MLLEFVTRLDWMEEWMGPNLLIILVVLIGGGAVIISLYHIWQWYMNKQSLKNVRSMPSPVNRKTIDRGLPGQEKLTDEDLYKLPENFIYEKGTTEEISFLDYQQNIIWKGKYRMRTMRKWVAKYEITYSELGELQGYRIDKQKEFTFLETEYQLGFFKSHNLALWIKNLVKEKDKKTVFGIAIHDDKDKTYLFCADPKDTSNMTIKGMTSTGKCFFIYLPNASDANQKLHFTKQVSFKHTNPKEVLRSHGYNDELINKAFK